MMNRTEAKQFIRRYLEPLSRAAEGLEDRGSSPYSAEAARETEVNPYRSSLVGYQSNVALRQMTGRAPAQREAQRSVVLRNTPSVGNLNTRQLATRALDEGVVVFSGRRNSEIPPALGLETAAQSQGPSDASQDSTRLAATRQYEDLSHLSQDDPLAFEENAYRSLGISRSDDAELDDLMRASFDGRRQSSQAGAQHGPLPSLSYQPRIHLGELDPHIEDHSGLNREMRTSIDRIIASGSRAERLRVRALEAGLETPRGGRLAERARQAYRVTILRRSRLQNRMRSLPEAHRARVEAYVNHESWRDFAMRFRVLAE
jgi:hypothetical protein